MKQRAVLFCAVVLIAALAALWGCADKPTDSNVQGMLGGVGFTGAIYTTNSGCTGVNVNIFANKADVYLDGGPQGGGSGLPNGNYYVQVTDPSGGTVLGKTLTAAVTVAAGEFIQCYQLIDILYSGNSGFTVKGYDDSPNGGGVYKVWVSVDPAFPNDRSKTDNFKVNTNGGGPLPSATLCVEKFYDANASGTYDAGDILLPNWKVRILDGIDLIRYTPVCVTVEPDDYTVSEYPTIETSWMPTTPVSVPVTLANGGNTTVRFGNLCLGAGGGLTLGFWSNKNGQSLFGADDLAAMVALNLRNATGANFDPTSYSLFRSWLLSATATNMAYMLSAQLAAMRLNVFNGKVNGLALIYAPGTTSANALGFATVNAVIAEANAELGLHGTALSGDSWRSYQEALKNALDKANNNLTFVQSTPCPFSFAL